MSTRTLHWVDPQHLGAREFKRVPAKEVLSWIVLLRNQVKDLRVAPAMKKVA